MSSASCSFKSDSTSFTDHYDECMENLSATKTAIEHSRVDVGKELDDFRVKIAASREATDTAIAQSRAETDRKIEQSRVDSKMEIAQMRLDADNRLKQMKKKLKSITKRSTISWHLYQANPQSMNGPAPPLMTN